MTYFFNFLTFESTKKRDDFAIMVLSTLLVLWLSIWLIPQYVNTSDMESNQGKTSIDVTTEESYPISESHSIYKVDR